jgi:2-methylisocitrate lyase-like PEP mutase family enzyme
VSGSVPVGVPLRSTLKAFREAVLAQQTQWAAGAYDALSARLIEQAGFEAVFTTGYGISASVLGAPDVGLYTMTENLTVVRNVTSAVRVPVIADADTGYGNTTNVQRTVREFEAAGVAGFTLEDQVNPKRCPLLTKKADLISVEDACAKIRAAIDARRDPQLLVIARTDARDPRAYAAAGADLIQPVGAAFGNIESLQVLRQRCGVPLSVMIAGWYRDAGKAQISAVAGLATFPLVPLLTAANAIRQNLCTLRQGHAVDGLPVEQMAEREMAEVLGLPELEASEQRYKSS